MNRVPGLYLSWIHMLHILVGPGVREVDMTLAMQARFDGEEGLALRRVRGVLTEADGEERQHAWLIHPATGEILDPSYPEGLAMGRYRTTESRSIRPDPPVPSLLHQVEVARQ